VSFRSPNETARIAASALPMLPHTRQGVVPAPVSFVPDTAARGLVHRLVLAFVWLTFFAGFFVVREPAPFDALMTILVVVLPVVGLTAINGGHVVYLAMWLVVIGTGFLAAGQAATPNDATMHMSISLYLVLASFVIAAFVAKDPQRHGDLILRAWTAAALVAAVSGALGYFDIPSGAHGLFTVHGRASGSFKDPNVYAPFLIPPFLFLLHGTLTRGPLGAMRATMGLAVLTLAIFLSFSRGGWLNLVVAVSVYLSLAFVLSQTDRHRVKLVMLTGGLAVLAIAILAVALESEAVSRLLSERAALTQGYDEGPQGRFGGQAKAWGLILSHPLGLGALQFGGVYHPEHPHNIYLSQFLNGGWIGGLVYVVILAATLALGFRAITRRRWASRSLLLVFAALVGLVVEGAIVETDHWRAFYIVLGLLWGFVSPRPQDVGAALSRGVAVTPKPLVRPARPRRAARLLLAQGGARARRSNIVAVVLSPVAPKRKRRRHEPTRKARLLLH